MNYHTRALLGGVLAIMVLAIVVLGVRFGLAFTGPSASGGVGAGALGVDASQNISIGTSTTSADTKLLIAASSTASTAYALKLMQPNGNTLFVVRNDGIVGINTSIPSGSSTSTLTVNGNTLITGSLTASSFSASLNASNVTAGVFGSGNFAFPSSLGVATTTQASLPQTLSVYGGGYFSGNVGIGVASPGSTLQVNGHIAIPGNYNLRSSTDFGNYFQPYQNITGLMSFATASTTRLAITYAGNVGIGTSTPQALLSVGNTTSSLVAIFGGGSGKIDVGTVDPLYTINGERYATYLPGMTGVKEETSGVAELVCGAKTAPCEYVIDLAHAAKGSDIWLFGKTTGTGKNSAPVAVLLTPSFEGKVWYEKDASRGTITIKGIPVSSSGSHEVSFRLTAPRFDANEWSNVPESGSHSGFIINE